MLKSLASAARVRRTFQALADGRTVTLGAWRLRRSSIQSDLTEFAWHDVIAVDRSEQHLLVRHKERGDMDIPLEEVPFPSLLTALARGLCGFARRE